MVDLFPFDSRAKDRPLSNLTCVRHIPRWLLFVVFVLVLAVGGLSSLAVVTMRESFPQTNGQVTVPVLGGTATVLRDDYGIPQIYADTPEDLFAAQGFVHAQDRFFEMDFRRHIVSGRLSELFGDSQIETDIFVRTLGWRRIAEQEANQLTGKTRRWMEAYAAGVNAYLQSPAQSRTGGDLSLEYSILGLIGGDADYQPEPWTVVDSIGWFKAMAWDVDGNRVDELERALLTQALGADKVADLFPDKDLSQITPIVGRGAVVDGVFDPKARPPGGSGGPAPADSGPDEADPVPDEADSVPEEADPVPEEALEALRSIVGIDDGLSQVLGDPRSRIGGSNSWAIAPSKTDTGSAILSNDPHLPTSMPGIFTQVGLHCTVQSEACPFDVVGYSFAGVPGVIIGQNADLAWGLTTPYVDTQDLFIEELSGNQVRRGDRWEMLDVREEQLRVRGEPIPRTITIRSTSHGPLLSDVQANLSGLDTGEGEYGVALAWTALQPGTIAEALFGLNSASNFDEFREAAQLMTSPSQNLVYADRYGNIGYQLPGLIPMRAKGDGNLPRPGWDPEWDWQGMIPFEELPWDFNPPEGMIVAANQPIVDESYPHHLGSSSSYGWRSEMIRMRLAEAVPVAPANSADLFNDTTMGMARDIVPRLLRVNVSDPWVREGQQTLVGWDYRAEPDSAAAAWFSVVSEQLIEQIFGSRRPEGVSFGGGDRWYAVLTALMDDPTNPLWDDPETEVVEDRDAALVRAMTAARRVITAKLSRDVSGWSWGKLHTVTLQHQTVGSVGIAPLDWIFNRGPLPIGGSTAVINAMAWQVGEGDFTVTAGPAMRMVVDFDDPDQSLWINQSGVSGHATHQHYDDQFALWARGELIPMVVSRVSIEERAVDELQLVPVA